jgi:soluble lytic murein transglycosylase-like protein
MNGTHESVSKLVIGALLATLIVLFAATQIATPAQATPGMAPAAWLVTASAPAASSRIVIPEQSARYRIKLEREAAAQFGLDAPVARIAAQIHQESGWDPAAESPYAQGLSQFTPETSKWLPNVCPDVGKPDAWDADWSLRAITCYDAYLYAHVSGASECDRWAFTLSAYNGGLGWLGRDRTRASANGADPARWFGHVESFSARAPAARAENRAYVRRILLELEGAYIAAGWPGEVVCT